MEKAREIVTQYTPFAYSVALRLTGNQADAWDLVQQAMLRVLKNYDSFDPSYKPEQWLYRIVRNLFMDRLRHEKRLKESPLEEDGDDSRRPLDESLVDPAPTPEQAAESRDRDARVQQGLDLLPAQMRMAVVLVDLQGCSYEEAAGILEIPASTLGVLVFRGRKLLRVHLAHLMEGGT